MALDQVLSRYSMLYIFVFFFNDTATTEIYTYWHTLSLHDALPICGVDYAFEMAGSVKAMDLCYRVTRRGGTTVTAGLSHPDHRFEVQHVSLVAEERTVTGSYIGSCVPLRDVPRYIAPSRPGRHPVARLLGARLLPEQSHEGFARLSEGRTVSTTHVS